MSNALSAPVNSTRMIVRIEGTGGGTKQTHYIYVPQVGYVEYNRYLEYQKGVDLRVGKVNFPESNKN
ncbi:hypothetical protein [Glutamicibacter sp. FBE19]|uniref:hypothetical protein n=1 Tax=Glutamicibacter sp. FBE19 TaxID=2761534 RepID=UPI001896A088|nr:hypothetical protein [Glutamicibacter sp. FBE19]MBF6671603.1 hypothetical protein [Glutamicibacter sp. FBE19]